MNEQEDNEVGETCLPDTPTVIELLEPGSSILLVPKATIIGHDPVYETTFIPASYAL
jgi:hypothetical protein